MTSQEKKAAYEAGLRAEQAAVDYLVRHGYAIRERRWSPPSGKGEIDIIAAIDNILVFAEVKAREGGVDEAISAVDSRKARTIALGADKYLRTQELWYEYRFDILAVDISGETPDVVHIPDAFLGPLICH